MWAFSGLSGQVILCFFTVSLQSLRNFVCDIQVSGKSKLTWHGSASGVDDRLYGFWLWIGSNLGYPLLQR
jgi:hypothetical protein